MDDMHYVPPSNRYAQINHTVLHYSHNTINKTKVDGLNYHLIIDNRTTSS